MQDRDSVPAHRITRAALTGRIHRSVSSTTSPSEYPKGCTTGSNASELKPARPDPWIRAGYAGALLHHADHGSQPSGNTPVRNRIRLDVPRRDTHRELGNTPGEHLSDLESFRRRK